MMGDGVDLRLQHLVHVGEVHVEDTGPRTVRRGPVVEGDRGRLLPERLDRANLQRRPRQPAEPARRRRHRFRDRPATVGQIGFAAGLRVRIFIFRAFVDVLEELDERAPEADLALDPLHLLMVAGDLAQADRVDLLGGHAGGRRLAEAPGIISGAIGQ